MQSFCHDTWTRILGYTVGPQQEFIDGDMSLWRICLRVETVSKSVRQTVHPVIFHMHELSQTRKLQILFWKTEHEITMHLNTQLWSVDNCDCAMRKCSQKTGLFVPWGDRGEYYEGNERSYNGTQSFEDELSGSSVWGSHRIDDLIKSNGPHLVVCSLGC